MNPDNPNFRTPEEEARAAELVRLKAEVARQARVIEKLKSYAKHRVDCICRAGVLEYSEECDCGLAAIEKEGEEK